MCELLAAYVDRDVVKRSVVTASQDWQVCRHGTFQHRSLWRDERSVEGKARWTDPIPSSDKSCECLMSAVCL